MWSSRIHITCSILGSQGLPSYRPARNINRLPERSVPRTIMKNNLDEFAKIMGRCGVVWSFNSLGKNLSSPNPCLTFPCHDCCSIVLQISRNFTCKRHNNHNNHTNDQPTKDAIQEAAFSKRMQPTSHRNSNLILNESPQAHLAVTSSAKNVFGVAFLRNFWGPNIFLQWPTLQRKGIGNYRKLLKGILLVQRWSEAARLAKKHLYCGLLCRLCLSCLSRLSMLCCMDIKKQCFNAWNNLKLRSLPHRLGCPTVCVASSKTRIASWSTSSMVSLTILQFTRWHLDFAAHCKRCQKTPEPLSVLQRLKNKLLPSKVSMSMLCSTCWQWIISFQKISKNPKHFSICVTNMQE